jgi:hypothetical protein
MQLKRQYRMYLKECKFQEADEVGAIIAKTERTEQEEAGRQMQRDFDEVLKKLRAKQASEVACAEDAEKLMIAQLRQKRNRGRMQLVNQRRRFEKWAEQIADPDRLWNMLLAQLREEIARGGTMEAPVRIAQLTEDELPAKDEAVLALPPLRIAATI